MGIECIDVDLLVDTVVHVINSLGGFIPRYEPLDIIKEEAKIGHNDISAYVTVTGDKNGFILATFTEACALALAKGMLGDSTSSDIASDTQDAVGEAVNIISGKLRDKLVSRGVTLKGSTPTVFCGDTFSLERNMLGDSIVLPFKTEYGSFVVEAFFEN